MTDYTLVYTDQYVRLNRASDINVIVPTNASVPYAIGHIIRVRQMGDGKFTMVGDTGVTINSPFTGTSAFKGAVIELIKVDTNEWDLSGDINVVEFTGLLNNTENLTCSEEVIMSLTSEISETVNGTEAFGTGQIFDASETVNTTEDFATYIPSGAGNSLLENGDTLVQQDGTSTILVEDGT
jgi:hypothetical protein